MTSWHELDDEEVLRLLGTGRFGLSGEEAAVRLARHGPNALVEKGGRTAWLILWDQLSATMVVLLAGAAVVSAAIGDVRDAGAIAAIIVLNSALGFFQEYRAARALESLKRLAAPHVRVRRDGRIIEAPARALVPGDILLLEAGDLIAADGRLLVSADLRVQEASLTGEAEAVFKASGALPAGAALLAERRNMVYMGTQAVHGRGEAVVTQTGMTTELGGIAAMLASAARDQTPLQKRLDQLGKRLALVAAAIVGVVFLHGLWRGEPVKLMFLTAVSLAVAAVPEGLPVVVTIALALGAQRMLRRKALVRKLPAVETLGSVTVICSDKTGTLTEGRMSVVALDAAGRQALEALLTAGALCNDARLEGSPGDERAFGDPTEAALLIAAVRHGLRLAGLREVFARIDELPFDAERKRMTTVHSVDASRLSQAGLEASWLEGAPRVAFTKGAVDGLLALSTRVLVQGRSEPLDEGRRRGIAAAQAGLAAGGMRVLGLALRPVGAGESRAALETGLVFIGLAGLSDPPRPEAKDAVRACRAAGIRPIMITGDHPLTAQAVAEQLGIAEAAAAVSGAELDGLSSEALEEVVKRASVFARVSPRHKLLVVEALARLGHVVAMTGDGVNDAPALKSADIGVAMGLGGTEVAKEASDMVLLDDNFATIVSAVEEGRVIYDNIRKFIRYLLTTNSAEILVMAAAPLLGMPLPLLPLQLLWINLVTDGPTALTLALEPAERDVMARPARDPAESLFGRGLGLHAVWVGLLMTSVSLGAGYLCWSRDMAQWRTMVFTTLAIAQMGHVMAVRSERDSLWRIGLWSNPWLLAAVTATLALQAAVVYVPSLRSVFDTFPLAPREALLAAALGSVVFWAVELEKRVKRGGGRVSARRRGSEGAPPGGGRRPGRRDRGRAPRSSAPWKR